LTTIFLSKCTADFPKDTNLIAANIQTQSLNDNVNQATGAVRLVEGQFIFSSFVKVKYCDSEAACVRDHFQVSCCYRRKSRIQMTNLLKTKRMYAI
jgi:hypothetical protein